MSDDLMRQARAPYGKSYVETMLSDLLYSSELRNRGREAERVAIVAWLRQQSDVGMQAGKSAADGSRLQRDLAAGVVAIRRAADAIERGDHINQGETK